MDPQRRMVLGLVAGSLGALAMTLLFSVRNVGAEVVRVTVTPDVTRNVSLVPAAGGRLEIPLPVLVQGARTAATEAQCFAAIAPAIAACIGAPGALTLEVVLGAEGADSAALLGVSGVSPPILDCVGRAVAAQPWPVASPQQVLSRPFVLREG